jgi:hypothetical protein
VDVKPELRSNTTILHMSIATRGLVRMLKAREASPSELFEGYGGTRAELIAELEKTPDRVYPLADCDNFDDLEGCCGHRVSSEADDESHIVRGEE